MRNSVWLYTSGAGFFESDRPCHGEAASCRSWCGEGYPEVPRTMVVGNNWSADV